jgi:hypothetical protein
VFNSFQQLATVNVSGFCYTAESHHVEGLSADLHHVIGRSADSQHVIERPADSQLVKGIVW